MEAKMERLLSNLRQPLQNKFKQVKVDVREYIAQISERTATLKDQVYKMVFTYNDLVDTYYQL